MPEQTITRRMRQIMLYVNGLRARYGALCKRLDETVYRMGCKWSEVQILSPRPLQNGLQSYLFSPLSLPRLSPDCHHFAGIHQRKPKFTFQIARHMLRNGMCVTLRYRLGHGAWRRPALYLPVTYHRR